MATSEVDLVLRIVCTLSVELMYIYHFISQV